MERTIINYTDKDITGKVFSFTDENMARVEQDARELLEGLKAKQAYLRAELRRAGYVADARVSDEVSRVADRVYDVIDIVKHGGRYVEEWGWSKAAKWNYIDQALEDAEFYGTM